MSYLTDILNFLNQYNTAFTVIFTFVVATATAVYAILTWKLVSETRKMRKSQTEPNVFLFFQPREEWINFIDMAIQNIGQGPAYDIKFNVIGDFEYKKDKLLSDLSPIKKGLNYLAPNQKIQTFFTSMVEDFKKKTEKPFEIIVSFKNEDEKVKENRFIIDFSEFADLRQLGGGPPLHQIAKKIENIEKDIHRISIGHSKIKTITYTKKDIEEENKETMKTIDKPS